MAHRNDCIVCYQCSSCACTDDFAIAPLRLTSILLQWWCGICSR